MILIFQGSKFLLMATDKTIRVYPSGQVWVVKKDGSEKASAVKNTKAQALEAAREIALNQGLVVIVHGKDGKIQKTVRPQDSSDEGCFITTACIKYYGLKDNCYQLQTLRKFRDSYLQKSVNNRVLVQNYYSIAPQLVYLLEKHKKRKSLFKFIFQDIEKACAAIEKKQFHKAKLIYQNTILRLLSYFKIS